MEYKSNLSSLNGKEGLVLDQDFTLNGALLFPKGTELTEENLDKLKNYLFRKEIDLNLVQLSVTLKNKVPNLDIAIELNHDTTEETIDKNMQQSIESILKEIEEVKNTDLPKYLRKLESCVEIITETILRNNNFSYSLANYKENSSYNDVINIVSFSIQLAKNYKPGLDKTTIKNIATAGLLTKYGQKYSDKNDEIQKLKFNDAFIKHTNEYDVKDNYKEEYQTSYAYSTFKGLLSNSTLMILLDSTKGINEVKKNDTNTYVGSRILHLATLYNEVLKEAIYDKNIRLDEINNILKMAVNSKNISIEERMLLVNSIPLYSKNERVLLSDGRYGIIKENGKKSYQTTELCDKPIIKIINSENKEEIIDLNGDFVYIEDIIGKNEKINLKQQTMEVENIIPFPNVEETEQIKAR